MIKITNISLSGIPHDDILAILGSVSFAVGVANSETRVIWVNKILCDLVGITEDEWIGKTTRELINEKYLDKVFTPANFKTKKEISGFVHSRSGMEIFFRSCPIFDHNQKIKYYVTTSTSISELNDLKMKLENERCRSSKYLREIEYLRKILFIDGDFVFESPEMKSLIDDVKKVALVDSTVLITGESGVGKEVLAKIIHNSSNRKNGPFIPVTIPSIPESLLEAELFGYVEGAYTGAVKGGKTGLFEIAQGGTLFLDEVGDCSYDIQVKILRAIETGEIRKIGSTKSISLNVRIIAATNKNLGKLMKQGRFREDLYYRLSIVPFHIKPLRERPEDIWPLCDHFIKKINDKYNLKKKFSGEALEILKSYKWPGNVRELKNMVERLAILSSENSITAEDVKPVLNSNLINLRQNSEESNTSSSLWEEFDSYERAKIFEVLKQVGGNKTKAAEMLGISRTKLYRKLRM